MTLLSLAACALHYCDQHTVYEISCAPGALRRNFTNKSVRLLKPSYLISLRNTAKIIPRRQEVPEDAFLDDDSFATVQEASLEVLSVSYCWVAKDHPGPEGYRLATLTKILDILEYQGEPKVDS